MTLSRFERKLLVALVAVAVMPMLGALFLGQAALREAYEVGVNDRVGSQLRSGLDMYRMHFVALRSNADNVATAVSNDYALVEAVRARDPERVQTRLSAIVALYPNLSALRLRGPDGETLANVERPREGDHNRASRHRPLQLERRLPLGLGRIELTTLAPMRLFTAHQQAGELVEVYSRLEQGGGTVSNYYLLVYMGFLLAVIALAIAVGIVLSRRVTRRIALLADATAKVGAGDLNVQVPTDVYDEIGELTHAFNAMVRDIHESRDRIEFLQRLGAWQEFARRLAHEIKNPLTPIQLAVQEIHRSYDGTDERFRARLGDAVSIVEEEVATLRRLVSEFSDFARMPQAQLEESDLRSFLAEAELALVSLAEEYPGPDDSPIAEVICEHPAGPLPVRIDAMMLRRVLDNLVRNAIQALRDAGRRGHVWIAARRLGQAVVLEVRDDGPGVPSEIRKRIFDPYVTSKSDGTGLGLAITKKVVIEHEGEISCGEGPEGGACFQVRLPLG